MGAKAIAIPVYYPDKGPPMFCVVRDRRFKDWTYITGGCRKREVSNPIRCALRELSEETRGVIKLFEGKYATYSFNVLLEGEYHTYNVFVFPMATMNNEHLKRTVQDFDEHKRRTDERRKAGLSIRLVQDENDYMQWVTMAEFRAKKLWHVAKDVAFSDLLTKAATTHSSIPWMKFSKDIVYGEQPPIVTPTRDAT